MYGSEHIVKDCLEYVVFEHHLSDSNGAWRIHGKIFPTWLPPRDTLLKTIRKPILKQKQAIEEKESEKLVESKEDSDSGSPQLAAA